MDLEFLKDMFSQQELTIALQLIVAMSLGMLLGAERTLAGKTAGMRTYALVCMSATLFTAVALVFGGMEQGANSDPLRVVAGIITGIGFLGAGLILFRDSSLQGLTTAAGIWISAGIGVTIGLDLYISAVIATLLTLFVFRALWFVEHRLKITWDNATHTKDNESE